MKTISFFSEKGGVGKSSFSIMYASWLKHKHRINVAVADFNGRIRGYRESERANRERLIKTFDPNLEPFVESETWPIVECTFSEIREIKKNTGSTIPYGKWFEEESTNGRLKDCDVVVCDFPGSLSGGEFFQLSVMNYLGIVVIPTEKDEMTLQSTLKLDASLKGKNHCLFLNKAQLGLSNMRASYVKLGQILAQKGLRILPDMVSFSDRMSKTLDKVDIIRSTFRFPDFNSQEYGKLKDLGIENLFIDVTKELNATEDIRGTAKVNLDFVNSLTKKNDRGQFAGSAFPQYEIVDKI